MGLYRVEGGCLYRIKIGRYHTALEREAPLSVHPASERQHQHQQHAGSSTSDQHQQQRSCLRPTHVARVPWRPTSPPFPSPLQPSSSISLPSIRSSFSLFLPFSPSRILSPTFIFPRFREVSRAPRTRGDNGGEGGEGGRNTYTRAVRRRERAPWRGEEITVSSKWREPVDDSGRALNQPPSSATL